MKSRTWQVDIHGRVEEMRFKTPQTKNGARKHAAYLYSLSEKGLRVWTNEEKKDEADNDVGVSDDQSGEQGLSRSYA